MKDASTTAPWPGTTIPPEIAASDEAVTGQRREKLVVICAIPDLNCLVLRTTNNNKGVEGNGKDSAIVSKERGQLAGGRPM